MSGESFAKLFEMMALANQVANGEHCVFSIDYQHADDVVAEDDMIPVIQLMLRPGVVKEDGDVVLPG